MRIGIIAGVIFLASSAAHAGDSKSKWVAIGENVEWKQPEQEGPPIKAVDEKAQSDFALDGKECTNNAQCRSSRICFQNRCMTKTQRHTIKTKAVNLIVPGFFLTVVGGAVSILGAVLMITDASDENSMGFGVYYGSFILVPGSVVFGTGIALLTFGFVRRSQIKRDKLAIDIRTKHGKLTLEPIIAAGENGGVFGLSGRF